MKFISFEISDEMNVKQIIQNILNKTIYDIEKEVFEDLVESSSSGHTIELLENHSHPILDDILKV